MSKNQKRALPPEPAAQATPEGAPWIGWVVQKDPDGNGYSLQKVRIPASWLPDLAQGPASPANLRPYLVQQVARDLMSDSMLTELHEAER